MSWNYKFKTQMDYSKIKIIIWDLDDTFWKGTLSEGGVDAIPENIELVKTASRHGVINSICSKNTKDETLQRLNQMGVQEYFVFPSIDWTPKGERIKRMLKTMGLRPQNALFLDDNSQNLNEAKHYSPELMTSEPNIIKALVHYYEEKPESDAKLKRLGQYKVLEEKEAAKSEFSSNDEFLYACNLHVEIHEDCSSQLERIAELVQRANQLNYTKVRSTKEELEKLIGRDDVKAGWVSVYDKFGDYGMVGFYAVDTIKNECIHFLFSCRTIGQGVEQYVYAQLGYPKLTVVGEVISYVNNDVAPAWINQAKELHSSGNSLERSTRIKILFKGPCDLQGLTKYIKGDCDIDEEFTYVGKRGNVIVTQNHTVSICGILKYTKEEKKHLIEKNIFMDESYYDSHIFEKEYDVVFLSSVLENSIGIYQRRGTELILPFGSGMYPLTDKGEWNRYLYGEGRYDNDQNQFTEDFLKRFSEEYEFLGTSSPQEYISRLDFILSHLSQKTNLCILLGSELRHENEQRPWMVDREKKHKIYNDALRQWASSKGDRVRLLDINRVITRQEDYEGSINHFTVSVYYKLAQEVIALLNDIAGEDMLKETSRAAILQDFIIRKSKEWGKIILPSGIFKTLRDYYHKKEK